MANPKWRPVIRKLRTFAFDPGLATELDTAELNEAVLGVSWEADLGEGPVGEYLEVVDYDPASGCFYEPVNLNDLHVLAQDGLSPSESDPQFHQQMVYAVAMTTIGHFERALGRRALWAPRVVDSSNRNCPEFVQRLRIYPHGLRGANAYYSPPKKACLFGYFRASLVEPGRNLPGGMVFTCLSHDVVAHEMTHALLDGLHPVFVLRTNPDTLALHEAFADVVALFQHFSQPEILRHQIAKTRGDLGRQNLLGQLAQQFGEAIGRRGALRDAIGRVDRRTGQWQPHDPDPTDYVTAKEPHARGAILVAAVFDAFLAIYKRRIADLLRIATGGTGVLPQGQLHPDLVNRMAREASKTARHVLRMCIRALDYVPPVDVTFGDYLRAMVTADWDLVPDDDWGYRIAIIEAFRRRGIYPLDVRSLAVDSLRWRGPHADLLDFTRKLDYLNWSVWDLRSDRRQIFDSMNDNQHRIEDWLPGQHIGEAATGEMGLMLDSDKYLSVRRCEDSPRPEVKVQSVRPARRTGPDGQVQTDLVVELTQQRAGYLDTDRQAAADEGKPAGEADFTFHGGCTLLVDVETREVRYCISKDITRESRLRRTREFHRDREAESLRATYFGNENEGEGSEFFARLHCAH